MYKKIKSKATRLMKRVSPKFFSRDELEGRRGELEGLLVRRDFEILRDVENATNKLTDHDIAIFELRNQLDCEGDVSFLHAHNFAGNLDHYHHFFGAVLTPFLELISLGYTNKETTYFVQKCGPLDLEIQEVADFYGLKVKFFPACLRDVVVGLKVVTHVHLPSYDYSYHTDWWLKTHQVAAVRKVALPISAIHTDSAKSDKYKILLVDRAQAHDYYSSPGATTGTSGTGRRSVPNMEELENALKVEFSVERVFLEHHSLAEKIHFFGSSDVVVGQMGAGLNGLLWMNTGASLVELHPLDTLSRDYAIFGNIAKELDILHYRIVQGQAHAAVNIDLVVAYIEQAVRDMN
jgi:hypothetical protein